MNEHPSSIHELFAYLSVRDANAAIKFYKEVFGAEELFRLTEPGGRIGHAQLKLGPTILMVTEEFPEYNILSPLAYGGTGVSIHLHVDNADELAAKAVAAGATMLIEVADQFYGERAGRVQDPFGHQWILGHEIEKLTPEEMQRRYTAMFDQDE